MANETQRLWDLLVNRLTAIRAGYLDELATANLPADVDTLKTYCDILDDAGNGLAAIKAEVEGLAGAAMRGTDGAALAASWTAALATALGNYTAARAAYLDNINNVNLASLISPVTETTGTFSFDETLAGEQTMVTVTITARSAVGGIWLDMVNVTQDTTIKLYHKVDGTNLREISSHSWTTTDSDGVLIDGFAAYRDVQITLTCGGGGIGAVSVPYSIV